MGLPSLDHAQRQGDDDIVLPSEGSSVTAKILSAADVALPRFEPGDAEDGDAFSLSSHARAREALEFALSVKGSGFNIFVLGEDHSGRMTATFDFMRAFVEQRPAPDDWLYLNNFAHPHNPKPHRLPAGVGRRFREHMTRLVPQLRDALMRAFGSEEYQAEVHARGEGVRAELAQRMDALHTELKAHDLELLRTPDGQMTIALVEDGKPVSLDTLSDERRAEVERHGKAFAEKLTEVTRWGAVRQGELAVALTEFERRMGDNTVKELFDQAAGAFSDYPALVDWLTEMRADVLDNLYRFAAQEAEAKLPPEAPPERHYGVNLLVDHSDHSSPRVILEANPTYENLFGRIEYRQLEGGQETDFTLIRGGSLHRANGGLLVLRADSLAANPFVWEQLKGALRDRRIHLEEPQRMGTLPIAGAPRPDPIPLDLKVVIVGSPRWYYTFFSLDPGFRSYFKVKADIDGDMEATPENLNCYAGLIRRMARQQAGAACDDSAVVRLLGIAARWASDRGKLSARFEQAADLMCEAVNLNGGADASVITKAAIDGAMAQRRQRNARVEDRLHDGIRLGTMMIDTTGSVVGQTNALTVRDMGDHTFGIPARVTARASVGRQGVTNIERDSALGGPIQQKGVMVLQGFLAGRFARRIPMSFNCSITFEQSYGGVEGDSASIAELLAIVSDLAGLPLRQDLAVTGSVNQRGQTQAVGGVHYKVEGFFRACVETGGLSGSQGVVLPAANEANLVLRDEVANAVAADRFHLWSIGTVDEAVELFTGVPAGVPDAGGAYGADTVYGRVMAQLETFDRILAERQRG
jgi:predicted ATP-dependent protease